MDIIAPVLEIVKLSWSPIGRRIGYLKNLKRNMDDLEKHATALFVQLLDVQEMKNTEQLKVATEECRLWIDDVEKAKGKVDSINAKREEDKKCLAGWCPNVKSRMELGKHIEDMIQEMIDLNDRRLEFAGREFRDAPLQRVEPQIVEINSSTDSEPRLQKILALIEDVGIRKIGIWGMGGIGKTRTLKLLNNRLEESHLFDVVIWVTVSGEGSRRKVQHDIAERLKCTAIDMSDNGLRAFISNKLSGKKFLLILDDIWERIDLSDVGIPILNQDNGCKVLLTTRDCGICQQMETDKEIQMERLSEEEAWSLFNEKVGDVAMSPRIESIARDIVKKCGGLPLAIIVIGSSLRKNDSVAVWRNTLRKLKLPITSSIKDMEKEVFSCLRISYDRLSEDSERKLFLYCSLYPEDSQILIAGLAEYCLLEGYIQGVDSIEEARAEGRDMVMNLVDASLLERGDNEEHVKMHDIIRDFALKEASKFLVKTGTDTKETGKLLYEILGTQVGDITNPEKKMKKRKLKGKDFSNAPLEKVEPQIVEINSPLEKVEPQIVEINSPLEKVVPQIVGFNSLTDSEPRLQKILALIEDVGIRKIGIWGMGGIGKTRTLKLLNNRLGESHMFDIVIWVTVSREGSRKTVQNDIAGRLNCTEKDMSNDDLLRAFISKNLSGKKFLLILDEIWERIDLYDVGIPILNQDNGCKVLLTTRDRGVCRQMETDVEIQIEKLSEDEAWSLFKEEAGNVAMSPCIKPIARDIIKKCSGLPLAIIVIGSSLRRIRHVVVWRNMLSKLLLPSSSHQIEGLEMKVFSCLKISYDRLPNDCERNLFLYCSLYPEDHEILIAELAEYCWLEGYIQEVDSIEEAQDAGRHMVMNLVDASLLESGKSASYVKMHDIMRDFALKEASGFLVKTGWHVKQPLEKEWLQSRKISLMLCSLDSLLELERPNCRTLSTLLLQYNRQLTVIPDSFFEYMHSLCILDLSRTEIKSLPSSLCNLVNLRGLYLKCCYRLEELPSEVGALTQLKVLHLGGSTAIKYLPREVEKLTCLKRLIVGFKKCERWRSICLDTKEWNMKLRVPTGIIPKLPYLEELSLSVTYHNVCVDKEQWDDESMEAVVEEMCRLEHLTSLDAYFPKVESLEHFLSHRKSLKNLADRRFRFRVGTEKTNISSIEVVEEWERCLVYNDGFGTPPATIKETLAHCSEFFLQDHRTARKLSELGLANMNELQGCWIIGCEKMETLFDGDEQQETCALLPNLNKLYIQSLPELRILCDGPLLHGSLSKLRELELHSCNNLKNVFQLSIIRRLCNLLKLHVDECSNMEEIIEIEEEEEMSMSVASHTHNVDIILIELMKLPELVSICRGFSNFEWPSLDTIEIFQCPKLKSLSFLSNGTNIVPPALKHIIGFRSWWEALEWEDNDIKQRLQPFLRTW